MTQLNSLEDDSQLLHIFLLAAQPVFDGFIANLPEACETMRSFVHEWTVTLELMQRHGSLEQLESFIDYVSHDSKTSHSSLIKSLYRLKTNE